MANRTINLSKAALIAKIKENKENHIKDYKEAVEAYKLEAKEQLEKQLKELGEGSLDIKLDLIKPVDRTKEYDKVVEMFEWENNSNVDLTQQEFTMYVQDQEPSAVHARMLNASYKAKFFE